MTQSTLRATLLTAGLAFASGAHAQISYTTPGSNYTESFSNAGGWGTGTLSATLAWTNNSTIPGWYAAYWANATSTATTPSLVMQSNGTQNTSNSLYIYRTTTDLTDGALGAFPINSQTGGAANAGGVFYGVRIANNTGITLSTFSLAYTAEVYRLSASAVANPLTVSYQVGATDITSGTWTSLASLAYNTPTGGATLATLDGNLVANKTTVSGSNFSVSLAPGQEIWFRWYDNNDTGTDNGFGIDNVTFSAIPEPSSFASLAGLGILGVAALRRRRA